MTASEPLLQVRDLVGGYGDVTVVRGVSLEVDDGESVGLLGPNGHGKTTLLRHISALNRARSGSVLFCGAEIARRSAAEIVELGLAHVPQGSRLFPECTVQENLALGSYPRRARSAKTRNLERVLTLFPKLAERRKQLCSTLSGGERQMVAIGVGLMAEPRLLVLDEPTLGLAPIVRDDLRERIDAIRRSGLSLVVVDGDLGFVFGLTDRWYAIESGRVSATGDSADGLGDREISGIYFGGGSQ